MPPGYNPSQPLSPFAVLDIHRRRPGVIAQSADFNLNDGRNNLLIHALIREEADRSAGNGDAQKKKRKSDVDLGENKEFELKFKEATAIDSKYLSDVVLKDYFNEFGGSIQESQVYSQELNAEKSAINQLSVELSGGSSGGDAAAAALGDRVF